MEWWQPPLSEVFAGRRVVIAGAVAAAWTAHVDTLRSVGVDDIMVYAPEGLGAGPTPDVTTVTLEPPVGLPIMEQIRYGNAMLADPPPDVVDALDRFDPDGDALVVGSFLNESPTLAGRPLLAFRRPEWVALEDKVVVDEFWDRAGVDRLPVEVVSLDGAQNAAARIDCGDGTVWSADARDGFHGGASQTWWVHDDASRSRALASLSAVCDVVRVMPFIEGTPCSVHGIVLPDGVAALRPVEMVVLRGDTGFVYAGCSTFWDPPDSVRETMRTVVRHVGRQLATETGFRGCFTVDGVVAADGFWPTELNPRFGGGIMTIARASGLPILLLNDIVVHGHDLGRTADEIEHDLIAAADSCRGGGTWIGALGRIEPVDRAVRFDGADGGEWHWAEDRDRPDGHVTGGDGFVRCTYSPEVTPTGPSTAARAAAFWRFADRELATGIGAVEPAPDPFT